MNPPFDSSSWRCRAMMAFPDCSGPGSARLRIVEPPRGLQVVVCLADGVCKSGDRRFHIERLRERRRLLVDHDRLHLKEREPLVRGLLPPLAGQAVRLAKLALVADHAVLRRVVHRLREAAHVDVVDPLRVLGVPDRAAHVALAEVIRLFMHPWDERLPLRRPDGRLVDVLGVNTAHRDDTLLRGARAKHLFACGAPASRPCGPSRRAAPLQRGGLGRWVLRRRSSSSSRPMAVWPLVELVERRFLVLRTVPVHHADLVVRGEPVRPIRVVSPRPVGAVLGGEFLAGPAELLRPCVRVVVGLEESRTRRLVDPGSSALGSTRTRNGFNTRLRRGR